MKRNLIVVAFFGVMFGITYQLSHMARWVHYNNNTYYTQYTDKERIDLEEMKKIGMAAKPDYKYYKHFQITETIKADVFPVVVEETQKVYKATVGEPCGCKPKEE